MKPLQAVSFVRTRKDNTWAGEGGEAVVGDEEESRHPSCRTLARTCPNALTPRSVRPQRENMAVSRSWMKHACFSAAIKWDCGGAGCGCG